MKSSENNPAFKGQSSIQKAILSTSFYLRDTCQVAMELLGKIIVHNSEEGLTAGMVVETEAYLQGDPSCHAYRGITPRNQVMFGPPGHVYIYFTYGMHYCFNVVTAAEGIGDAVLIRALEPLEGLDLMSKRRDRSSVLDFCSGPAKLVQAMGLVSELYGHDLTREPLTIHTGIDVEKEQIIVTNRIGIKLAQDLPLRFYIKDNQFVSRR